MQSSRWNVYENTLLVAEFDAKNWNQHSWSLAEEQIYLEVQEPRRVPESEWPTDQEGFQQRHQWVDHGVGSHMRWGSRWFPHENGSIGEGQQHRLSGIKTLVTLAIERRHTNPCRVVQPKGRCWTTSAGLRKAWSRIGLRGKSRGSWCRHYQNECMLNLWMHTFYQSLSATTFCGFWCPMDMSCEE